MHIFRSKYFSERFVFKHLYSTVFLQIRVEFLLQTANRVVVVILQHPSFQGSPRLANFIGVVVAWLPRCNIG